MIPGELFLAQSDIEINQGREKRKVMVINHGDRPIQVGSHYHFYEANQALSFERAQSYGFRLDIAAGTAIRFEPAQRREVELVALSGTGHIYGFQGKVMGPLIQGEHDD